MTKAELISYYADLIILQYKGKPRARAHVELLCDMVTIDLLPLDIKGAFDLDSAVGVQLDSIGKYMGASRSGYGFDSFITLTDEDYRKLIKLLIVKNYSDATLYDMKNIINEYFGTSIILFDFKGMRMGYYLDISVGSNNLAQLVVNNGILPAPMGVQLSASIYAPDINIFYGLVTYQSPVAYNNTPLNTYEDYRLTRPWLQYSDSVEEGAILLGIGTEDGSDLLTQEDDSFLYY